MLPIPNVHRVIQCLPVCQSVTQFAQGHTVLDNISVEFRRKNLLVNLLNPYLQTQSSVMQQARVFFPEATSNQPPIFPHWPALPIQKQKICHKDYTDSNFCLKIKILTQKCYSLKIVLFSCAFPPNRLRRRRWWVGEWNSF